MTVGKKILADQVICSPISSASFFVGAGLLEGCSFTECWKEYKDKFLMVYLVRRWSLVVPSSHMLKRQLFSFSWIWIELNQDRLRCVATESIHQLLVRPTSLSSSLRQCSHRSLECVPLLRQAFRKFSICPENWLNFFKKNIFELAGPIEIEWESRFVPNQSQTKGHPTIIIIIKIAFISLSPVRHRCNVCMYVKIWTRTSWHADK